MQKSSFIPTILLIAVWIDFVFLSLVIKQDHYAYLNLLPLALGIFFYLILNGLNEQKNIKVT